jgi:hypothetical protein
VVDRLAIDFEQARRPDEHYPALRARGGDVDAVVEEKRDSASSPLELASETTTTGAFLSLELVDRPDAHADYARPRNAHVATGRLHAPSGEVASSLVFIATRLGGRLDVLPHSDPPCGHTANSGAAA